MLWSDKNNFTMPLILITNTVIKLKLKGKRQVDFSMEIDRIFDMLFWDNKEEIQAKGIEEAKKISTKKV